MILADWNIPVKDFACKGHSAMCEVSKLSKCSYDKIPVAFAQSIAWGEKIQCVQIIDESIFDYYDRFEKVFKQYCGIDKINNELQHFIPALVKSL